MENVYLGQPWGGLGDNLQFSSLPRLYHEQGIDFYLSNQNAYRNSEIYEFCWGKNPYVKGIVDHPPTIGSCAPPSPPGKADNIIAASEIRHGFLGKSKYPEIYYKPNYIEELSNKILVDLSAHSVITCGIETLYNVEKLHKLIDENIPSENVLFVKLNHIDTNFLTHKFNFPEKSFLINNLFHYADCIHSCKEYYCMYSGGNSMASGIKFKYSSKVKINCFLYRSLQEHKDMGFFVYDNVNYIEC
jgi:hypothetical protein